MMRFLSLPRLMRVRVLDMGTFSLMKELVTATHEYEDLARSQSWGSFCRHRREKKKEALRGRLNELRKELLSRYLGVMVLAWRRLGVPTSQLSQTTRATVQALSDRVRTLEDPRDLPAALWSVCCDQVGESRGLKARFMLRAFIDEMRPGVERGALLRLYAEDASVFQVAAAGFLAHFDQALFSLHREVRRRRKDLDRLTDSELCWRDVENFNPPYLNYADLLLAQVR